MGVIIKVTDARNASSFFLVSSFASIWVEGLFFETMNSFLLVRLPLVIILRPVPADGMASVFICW